MDEKLTIEEIERRYAGKWVVMTDIEAKPGPVFTRARVYWHGSDRDEAYAKADEIPPPRNIGVWFMGPVLPEGVYPLL